MSKLRAVALCAITVAVLAGVGRLLYAPPVFLSALTGATVHAVRVSDALEGSYLLGMNTQAQCLADESVREAVKAAAMGEAMQVSFDGRMKISVQEGDQALLDWANALCVRLKQAGIAAQVRAYSPLMLRSRLLGETYEVFLSTRGFIDAELLAHTETCVMDAEEMRAAFADADREGASA